MEGQEVMLDGSMSNGFGVVSCGDELEKVRSENGSAQEDDSEKVEGTVAEVLEHWEEYWEDISDRLMISRMVSDSVIKGILTAVEEEAAGRIAEKELEVANLKKCLQSREVGTCKFEDVKLPVAHKVSCSVVDCQNNERMREDLNALRNLAGEQFERVMKEIEFNRGCDSVNKIGSGTELVGLGGILHVKQCEKWMYSDKMLEGLKATLDAVCKKVDDILLYSDFSFCEIQHDLGLSATLEDSVDQTARRSLQEEFEENLLEQNAAQFCGIQNMNWLEKFNDVSSLGTKLDAILKSLSGHETELASHDMDHLLHKAFGNHITLPIAHYGENGSVDASNIHVAESYNFEQLKHMSKEELVDYFNDIITKIKRDHESALHQKTEEYFRLKREYLKVKGSFTTHRKDEEFDVLRKEIPEIISKLQDFLSENERFPALTHNLDSVGKLKHRLENILSENCDLRDHLADKENEVKRLNAQASRDASELLHRSLAEENLKSEVEYSHVESALSAEVYKCALREQIAQTRHDSQDSNMEFAMTREIYDIILREAAIPVVTANGYGIDDSDVESFIMQELNGLMLTEFVKDVRRQLDEEIRICLEATVLEKENELKLEVEEKEKLKQVILYLRTEVEQREKFAMDLSVSLSKEREQFELASQELTSLREHASLQQTWVINSNKEIESLRSQHLEALGQIEVNKMEMHKLSQKLDQAKVLLAEVNEEREKACTVAQERLDKLLFFKAREETLKKEMEMAAKRFSRIFVDFECRVSGSIKRTNLRLEDTSSDCKALTKTVNVLRRKGLMYKNKLEKCTSDLQMAESEVDLLGDEVDALFRLLEKIYIALDHYSPVLKHYPGIIEILELVRRELTGEYTLRS